MPFHKRIGPLEILHLLYSLMYSLLYMAIVKSMVQFISCVKPCFCHEYCMPFPNLFQQRFPDEMHFKLSVEGKDYTLHLEKNKSVKPHILY